MIVYSGSPYFYGLCVTSFGVEYAVIAQRMSILSVYNLCSLNEILK